MKTSMCKTLKFGPPNKGRRRRKIQEKEEEEEEEEEMECPSVPCETVWVFRVEHSVMSILD